MNHSSQTTTVRAHRLRWLAPLSVAIAIAVVTSWPSPPSMPGQSDKMIHFLAYGALGSSVAWAAQSQSVRYLAQLGLCLAALGAVDEWHQQFIPARAMDVRDWVADTAGAVSGLLLVTALNRRREFVA